MLKKLFSKYLKWSFIISFLSVFQNYTMEFNDGPLEMFSETEQQGSGINFLECLPPELLLNILLELPFDDSGFEYLKRYYKFLYKGLHKELAELDIDKFWEKCVLISNNLQELKQRIEDKYRALGKDFPNYNTLNDAYNNVIVKKYNYLTELSNNIYLDLKFNFQQKDWLEFNRVISKFHVSNLPANNNNEKHYYLKLCSLIIKNVKNNLIFDVFKHISLKAVKKKHFASLCLVVGTLMTILSFSFLRTAWDYGYSLHCVIICCGIILCADGISYKMVKYHLIKPTFQHTISKINTLLHDLEIAINEIQSENTISK